MKMRRTRSSDEYVADMVAAIVVDTPTQSTQSITRHHAFEELAVYGGAALWTLFPMLEKEASNDTTATVIVLLISRILEGGVFKISSVEEVDGMAINSYLNYATENKYIPKD